MLRHKDFQFYLVSEFGEVYSNITKKFLKPFTDGKRGYLQVRLTPVGGKPQNMRIHRLVAEIYVPNPDNKPEVNHLDMDILNNHYSNLEWVTNQENMTHRKRNSVIQKLTYEQKCEILELWKSGRYYQKTLASMYGVTRKNITYLVNHFKP